MFKIRVAQRQRGFSLIEMALVLVILGIVLAFVLNGEQLIASAKKKRLVEDFREFEAAFNTFLDGYGQYPGDENDIRGIPLPEGDTENGNGNGLVDAAEDDNFGRYVWNDLLKSGTSKKKTANPFGGVYGWEAITFHPTDASGIDHYRNTVYATNIPADQAREIDLSNDDGIWNTGSIMSSANYDATITVTLFWRL